MVSTTNPKKFYEKNYMPHAGSVNIWDMNTHFTSQIIHLSPYRGEVD